MNYDERMSGWKTVLIVTLATLAVALGGCSRDEPTYDLSTPQAALDSMYQMVTDGQASMIGRMIHIEARDIAFDDGVTEASAIQNVTEKAGDMLGQLYRVAGKLRERFPDSVRQELALAVNRPRTEAVILDRFLADPFGLMDEQRSRITVEDLGDGTAAILVDGKPAFGFGLQMKQVDGQWKIDLPVELLQEYRPNTREEWSVLANMMLSLENAFTAFEDELDRGDFRTLSQAADRAGRLLGERAIVQALIYRTMKSNTPSSTRPATN